MAENLPALKHENVEAEYETDSKLFLVKYRGQLSPAVTNVFYQWLIPAMQTHPTMVQEARGSIYDFRDVTDFVSGNMTTARRQSHAANQSIDLQNHPVALIVDNPLQERMVSIIMKLTEQTDRKRLVRSMSGAREFIDYWHETHGHE